MFPTEHSPNSQHTGRRMQLSKIEEVSLDREFERPCPITPDTPGPEETVARRRAPLATTVTRDTEMSLYQETSIANKPISFGGLRMAHLRRR